ncbi:hypothetical protein NL676_001853 [Syzygium grande]|nr:hypothetical protein NL676_001853 [Syzygium grande]
MQFATQLTFKLVHHFVNRVEIRFSNSNSIRVERGVEPSSCRALELNLKQSSQVNQADSAKIAQATSYRLVVVLSSKHHRAVRPPAGTDLRLRPPVPITAVVAPSRALTAVASDLRLSVPTFTIASPAQGWVSKLSPPSPPPARRSDLCLVVHTIGKGLDLYSDNGKESQGRSPSLIDRLVSLCSRLCLARSPLQGLLERPQVQHHSLLGHGSRFDVVLADRAFLWRLFGDFRRFRSNIYVVPPSRAPPLTSRLRSIKSRS